MLRRELMCTGWSTSRTFPCKPRCTSKIVNSGCPSTNCVGSNTVFSRALQLSSWCQWSGSSLLSLDLQFQCSQWLTSWTGATCGAMRTGLKNYIVYIKFICYISKWRKRNSRIWKRHFTLSISLFFNICIKFNCAYMKLILCHANLRIFFY